jgi:hypothetical protein
MEAAERIAGMMNERYVPVVVIGAVALAAYRYVRFTEDIDLESSLLRAFKPLVVFGTGVVDDVHAELVAGFPDFLRDAGECPSAHSGRSYQGRMAGKAVPVADVVSNHGSIQEPGSCTTFEYW